MSNNTPNQFKYTPYNEHQNIYPIVCSILSKYKETVNSLLENLKHFTPHGESYKKVYCTDGYKRGCYTGTYQTNDINSQINDINSQINDINSQTSNVNSQINYINQVINYLFQCGNSIPNLDGNNYYEVYILISNIFNPLVISEFLNLYYEYMFKSKYDSDKFKQEIDELRKKLLYLFYKIIKPTIYATENYVTDSQYIESLIKGRGYNTSTWDQYLYALYMTVKDINCYTPSIKESLSSYDTVYNPSSITVCLTKIQPFYEKEYEELESNYKELESNYKELESNYKKLESNYKKLESEKESLSRDLESKINDNGVLSEKNIKLHDKVNMLNTQVQETESCLKNLNKSYDDKIRNLQRQVEEQLNRIRDNMNDEKKRQELTYQQNLNSQTENFNQEIKKLTEEEINLKNENLSLKKELDDIKTLLFVKLCGKAEKVIQPEVKGRGIEYRIELKPKKEIFTVPVSQSEKRNGKFKIKLPRLIINRNDEKLEYEEFQINLNDEKKFLFQEKGSFILDQSLNLQIDIVNAKEKEEPTSKQKRQERDIKNTVVGEAQQQKINKEVAKAFVPIENYLSGISYTFNYNGRKVPLSVSLNTQEGEIIQLNTQNGPINVQVHSLPNTTYCRKDFDLIQTLYFSKEYEGQSTDIPIEIYDGTTVGPYNFKIEDGWYVICEQKGFYNSYGTRGSLMLLVRLYDQQQSFN
ncbi:hypothetical protein ENU1_178780 [Entamoeba nuttalli P19]|uniref:Uncharacterized protein n=1 Tax=Entamoeba nuttalli (strain P19) TaxID=1076696 RepID=K2GW50_ENTNP|nr:hypothetical protein ENU1_178780 [Entamoeba nuttalli P19]EKE38037.1 hypothetical protein ENU1_178780 [Entamoeba nuttalli P19]|eukprot:XP_008859642.1 hypothetical protein ENU1_178780 [Entamoeba nuttalli P19]